MYFIVENRGRPVGTIRLYDQDGTECTWGSWILTNDRPDGTPKESALMIYALSDWLGFTSTLFDVRKPNEKVWGFLSPLGASTLARRMSHIFSRWAEGQLARRCTTTR